MAWLAAADAVAAAVQAENGNPLTAQPKINHIFEYFFTIPYGVDFGAALVLLLPSDWDFGDWVAEFFTSDNHFSVKKVAVGA